MRIGVYGGSFNPPHLGHLDDAIMAQRQLGLDRLIIVPCGTAPHKPMPEGTPDDETRLELCRAAFGEEEGRAISDMEIRRGGASYTVDTLEELKSALPSEELFFIMGGDMLETFCSWREPKRIASLASLAVLRRGESEEAFSDAVRRAEAEAGARVIVLENNYVDVSSSYLRMALALGCADEYLPASALELIKKRGLYDCGEKPEAFEPLLSWALRRVKPKRAAHVIGCVEMAERLAARWGADIRKAKTAAALHDITKSLSFIEQLKLCNLYDIIPDVIEAENHELMHALTGAKAAEGLLSQPEDICSAIRWHTTGKADMTKLEKIIYLADTIEKNREFEGVSELRALAERDLDRAVLSSLERGIAYVSAKGQTLHPSSLEARDWLKKGL